MIQDPLNLLFPLPLIVTLFISVYVRVHPLSLCFPVHTRS